MGILRKSSVIATSVLIVVVFVVLMSPIRFDLDIGLIPNWLSWGANDRLNDVNDSGLRDARELRGVGEGVLGSDQELTGVVDPTPDMLTITIHGGTPEAASPVSPERSDAK